MKEDSLTTVVQDNSSAEGFHQSKPTKKAPSSKAISSSLFVAQCPNSNASPSKEEDVRFSVEDCLSSDVNLASISAHCDDPTYVVDLSTVFGQYQRWIRNMPRVQPFFAVKCNPNEAVVRTLAACGIGFDCASKTEIELVLAQGVSPSRLLYANPCKSVSSLKYARSVGVRAMTFDNLDELPKIQRVYPEAELILRIYADDSHSTIPLGTKFGAPYSQCALLLKTATSLGLKVIGVSFHVGSGCYSAQAFVDAVRLARSVYDLAANMGVKMELIDIGGGFPGVDGGLNFETIASALRPALDEAFPSSLNLKLIAEPGRYFVAAAFTLITSVIETQSDSNTPVYYINDSVYGSFKDCVLVQESFVPRMLTCSNSSKKSMKVETRLMGNTAEDIDLIATVPLPQLEVGDHLVFDNMGAYTLSLSSSTLGTFSPILKYVWNSPSFLKQ